VRRLSATARARIEQALTPGQDVLERGRQA
jgi:hypothetical protein